MSKRKILLKLTGSIACFKAAALASKLVQSGFEVQTVATPSALKFIGEATLEGLTGRKVLKDTFESGDLMGHLNWAKWADLTIVYPATANTINKLANGIGDDLVSTLFLAHDFDKPYLIAPAMNTRIYDHPATQESLKRLKSYGAIILDVSSGQLACGDIGKGRLIENDEALREIEKHVLISGILDQSKLPDQKSILITSGGTREPIDGVRSIANTSTGATGAAIAEHLADVGHDVTLLAAVDSRLPTAPIEIETFSSFSDLNQKCQRLLSERHFDSVIHLAAVSDYSVAGIEIDGTLQASADTKIESDRRLKLVLKPNFKIVDRLRNYSKNKSIQVIAFKLTKNVSDEEAFRKVKSLFEHSSSDFVVHNDLNQISSNQHKAQIFARKQTSITTLESKTQLAIELERIIREAQP